MNIYDENGYIAVKKIIKSGTWPFVLFIGGRGTGKTYGVLDFLYEERKQFMLLRRTQLQADIISNQQFSPLAPLSEDLGFYFETQKLVKQIGMIKIRNGEDEYIAGYTSALSTFSNVRGFNAREIKYLFFDEFNPEPHERLIKDEGGAFLNCYETINRNRELYGEPPLTAILCGNSNTLNSPIFFKLDIIRQVIKAKKIAAERGHAIIKLPERGILLVVFDDSPISNRKSDTALYRASGEGDFSNMALGNSFTADEESIVQSKNLREYKLLCTVTSIHIYNHKFNSTYYISKHRTGTATSQFGSGTIDLERFRKKFGYLWREYLNNKIIFESYAEELIFKNIFK